MKYIIYTDASIGENNFSISILIGRKIKTPTGSKTQIIRTYSKVIDRKAKSSTEAEVEAILKAIEISERIAEGNVIIYTDCLNAVNMMIKKEDRDPEWFEKYFFIYKKPLNHLRQNILDSPLKVDLVKVEAHSGRILNEYVDTAAKIRRIQGNHILFSEFRKKWANYTKSHDKTTKNPREQGSSRQDPDR